MIDTTNLTDAEAMVILASDDITDADAEQIVADMVARQPIDSHAYKIVVDFGDEVETYYCSEPPNVAGLEAIGAKSVTVVRPTLGTRVTVTFAGNDWHDAETVVGVVTDRDDDSIEVTPDGATIGEDFTLFDAEQARGTAVVEVIR